VTASLTHAISSSTYVHSPPKTFPTLTTISTSCAPVFTASAASWTLTAVKAYNGADIHRTAFQGIPGLWYREGFDASGSYVVFPGDLKACGDLFVCHGGVEEGVIDHFGKGGQRDPYFRGTICRRGSHYTHSIENLIAKVLKP